MSFTTWVRVEDDFGQYDHPTGLPRPEGARLVEKYPEHVATNARPPKARVRKDGTAYDGLTVNELKKELEDRGIEPEGNKHDLVAALELHDELSIPGFPPDPIEPESPGSIEPDSGEHTTTHDAGDETGEETE